MTLYPEIHASDEPIHAMFNHEIDIYRRGFTMGIFGSSKIKTGGGKSIGTLAMASDIDPDFTLKNVAFTPRQMLQLVSKAEHAKRPRMAIVMEESQTMISSRTWQTQNNKVIVNCVATMRDVRAAAFFNTPMQKMIDGDVQKLMRFGSISRLAYQNGKLAGYLRPYEIRTWGKNDENIAKDPWILYSPEKKKLYSIEELRVYLPEKSLVREYEYMVAAYKSQYRLDLDDELAKYEDEEKAFMKKSRSFKPSEVARDLLKEPQIIDELTKSNDVSAATIRALRPGLSSPTDLGAIRKWVGWNWKKLNEN